MGYKIAAIFCFILAGVMIFIAFTLPPEIKSGVVQAKHTKKDTGDSCGAAYDGSGYTCNPGKLNTSTFDSGEGKLYYVSVRGCISYKDGGRTKERCQTKDFKVSKDEYNSLSKGDKYQAS